MSRFIRGAFLIWIALVAAALVSEESFASKGLPIHWDPVEVAYTIGDGVAPEILHVVGQVAQSGQEHFPRRK